MDNIDIMQAGRDIDTLVAEQVMGWNVTTCDKKQGDDYFGQDPSDGWIKPVPNYSTDMGAAWKIIESRIYDPTREPLYSQRCQIDLSLKEGDIDIFVEELNIRGWRERTFKQMHITDLLPLAICKMALKIFSDKKEND